MGNFDLNRLKLLQESLRSNVVLRSQFTKLETIAGVDVSYSRKRNLMVAAVVVMDFDSLKIIETSFYEGVSDFPYIPTYLSFRELPPIVEAFKLLRNTPNVTLVDGQGIAHPRGLGLATHIGVELNIPTIGCAKSRLVGEYKEPCKEKGCYEALTIEGKQVGWVVRSRTNVKPVFVSPGHEVSLEDALSIVMRAVRRYRLPEPIRMAHSLSKAKISVEP